MLYSCSLISLRGYKLYKYYRYTYILPITYINVEEKRIDP